MSFSPTLSTLLHTSVHCMRELNCDTIFARHSSEISNLDYTPNDVMPFLVPKTTYTLHISHHQHATYTQQAGPAYTPHSTT